MCLSAILKKILSKFRKFKYAFFSVLEFFLQQNKDEKTLYKQKQQREEGKNGG